MQTRRAVSPLHIQREPVSPVRVAVLGTGVGVSLLLRSHQNDVVILGL